MQLHTLQLDTKCIAGSATHWSVTASNIFLLSLCGNVQFFSYPVTGGKGFQDHMRFTSGSSEILFHNPASSSNYCHLFLQGGNQREVLGNDCGGLQFLDLGHWRPSMLSVSVLGLSDTMLVSDSDQCATSMHGMSKCQMVHEIPASFVTPAV